jgi:NAD(P)-dependent dehydrogenase (short-subunit alcohol dehydrogenase family)
MSKAALNMFTKTLSVEMKRHHGIVVSYHPGTTDTALSKPFQKNVNQQKLFSADQAARSLLSFASDLQLSDTGKFFAYDRSIIPY